MLFCICFTHILNDFSRILIKSHSHSFYLSLTRVLADVPFSAHSNWPYWSQPCLSRDQNGFGTVRFPRPCRAVVVIIVCARRSLSAARHVFENRPINQCSPVGFAAFAYWINTMSPAALGRHTRSAVWFSGIRVFRATLEISDVPDPNHHGAPDRGRRSTIRWKPVLAKPWLRSYERGRYRRENVQFPMTI